VIGTRGRWCYNPIVPEVGDAMATRPTFASLSAKHFLDPQVEKRLFGGKFVRLGPLLSVGVFLFQNGAVLGHAFRGCFDVFVVPFSAEPNRPEAVEWIRHKGHTVAAAAETASTINELVMINEMWKDDLTRPPSAWSEWFMARRDKRVAAEFAMQVGMLYGIVGAGFGAEFPKHLEELYANSYGKLDPDTWHEAHKYGAVDTPEPPQYVPFQERQQEAVAEFAEFCTQFYPEVLVPLGLR
jgi:hypothetical protein